MRHKGIDSYKKEVRVRFFGKGDFLVVLILRKPGKEIMP